MQNTDFSPRYTFRGLWDVLLISFGLLFALVLALWKQGLGLDTFSILIVLVLFCFWWMHSLIRHIAFSHSSFTIASFFLPPKTINYFEVTDLGFSKIKTKKGDVSFAGMSNGKELLIQFRELVNQGAIDQDQLEMELIVEDTLFEKTILPSLIVYVPLGILLLYFWPYYHCWFSTLGLSILAGLTLYAVNFVIRLILKKRLDG